MTDTINDVAATRKHEPVKPVLDEQGVAEQLVAQARAKGVDLVGPTGLLTRLTKQVFETALDEEMSEHLGYDKHDRAGRNSGNSRNGVRSKTVLTEIGPVEIGPVEIDVPRDIDASFTPQIVKKRQRRLTGVDEIVLSLTARGLTTGEISAHFAEVYGASVKQGDDFQDHRQGGGGDDGLVQPAVGRGLSGDFYRRDCGQGPGRAGPEQADLRGHRGHGERGTRHLGPVGP
jgi:hypothetical protein